MANEQNLIYGDMRSKSEARENGRKGGVNSGKSRRQRKLAKDLMIALLNTSVEGGVIDDVDEIKSIRDIEDKNVTALAKGLASLAKGVAKGDRKDIELALKIAGEWVEKSEATITDATTEAYQDYVREKSDSGKSDI